MLHAIMYVVCKINARRIVSSIIKKVNKTNLGTQERDMILKNDRKYAYFGAEMENGSKLYQNYKKKIEKNALLF